MRNVTAKFKEALQQPVIRAHRIIAIDHPDGWVYAWDGVGTLSYGGNDYLGVGYIGGVRGGETTSEVRIAEGQLILTNVPAAEASDVNIDLKGRQATCSFVLLDQHLQVIPDPDVLFVMDMDYQAASLTDNGTHTITIFGSLGMWTMDRASNLSWTPEEQKKLYPNDTGLELVHTMQNKEVTWTLV